MEVNGQLLVLDPIRFSVIDRFQSLPPTHAITSKAQAARPVHPPLSPHLLLLSLDVHGVSVPFVSLQPPSEESKCEREEAPTDKAAAYLSGIA